MKNEIIISIIMAVYNETEQQIVECLESIISQTYSKFEVIIVNDNPESEQFGQMLTKIIGTDSRFKLFNNDVNYGLVYSLNRAISESCGKYIARMDPDDISYPNRLEYQLNYLESKGLDLCGANIDLIDESGKYILTRFYPEHSNDINKFIKWGNCVPHPTWLGRRKVFINLNGYRYMKNCEDYDFILRALRKRFKIGNCDQILLKYRIRENGVSKTNAIQQKILRQYLFENRLRIESIDHDEILYVQASDKYNRIYEVATLSEIYKHNIRSNEGVISKIYPFCKLLLNRYFINNQIEKFIIKLRGYKMKRKLYSNGD